MACHGPKGQGGLVPGIDLTVDMYAHSSAPDDFLTLERYIELWMGPSNPTACVGQCAADVTAYVLTFTDAPLQNAEENQKVCEPTLAYQAPIRRITEGEYDNAVQELLGVSMHGTTNLTADSRSGSFATNRGTPASSSAVINYLESAELISKLATGELDSRYSWVLAASNNEDDLGNVIDGDPSTRWGTGTAQEPGQWLTIDMGAIQRFNGIEMAHQASRDDFPVRYEVNVSNDGSSWGNVVASGSGTRSVTTVNFDTVEARHIRIRQLGRTDRLWWAIHELEVLEGGDPISASGNVSCGNAACARNFVDRFVRRAYRGSATNNDVTALRALLNEGGNVTEGIQIVIEAVLQSPKFLYQVERSVSGSGPASKERLTGLSIAEKLASFLWNSIPDEALLEAAENGDLDTDEGVQEQAARMMRDPRSTESFADFVEQWFETDLILTTQKDTDVFPQFTDGLRAAMRQETKAFVEWMIESDNFNYQELLTSSKAFPSGALAEFYGVRSQSNGAPVDLDGRVGIATHPSVSASHARLTDTSVVSRGDFLLDALLCIELPEPPANVEALFAQIDPTLPTRERLALHTAEPSCASCHDLIDPLGFSLESYDAIGAFRTRDILGFPVETFGTLSGTDQDGQFDDVTGLMDRVLASKTGPSCAVEQWMRFAQRRVVNEADECSVNTITQEFENSGYDFNALVRAVVTSDAFLFRDSTGADR